MPPKTDGLVAQGVGKKYVPGLKLNRTKKWPAEVNRDRAAPLLFDGSTDISRHDGDSLCVGILGQQKLSPDSEQYIPGQRRHHTPNQQLTDQVVVPVIRPVDLNPEPKGQQHVAGSGDV